MTDITISPLKTLDAMYPAVALQRTYWGDDFESVVPAHMLFSLATGGGHVLGAFDGEALVGLLIGFLGTDADERRPALANLQLISKRMIVLPSHRGRGIGYRLKLAQRDRAVQQGVRLITWTFDPVLAVNAHLNLRKLGAICPAYRENYYGTSQTVGSGLVRLGTSDRLVAEWWVTQRRVEERLFGTRRDLTLAQYLEAGTPILNPTSAGGEGLPLPAKRLQDSPNSLALVEIPTDYEAIERSDEGLARSWRAHVGEAFARMFVYGFVVTDFLRGVHEGRERSFYLMSYDGPQFESFSVN